ncbi:MAG TPA: IS1380 family transposase [Acidimicrobiales bacterium]|nr:IS1380 family transposase [Acidimicrobiales bacterium]
MIFDDANLVANAGLVVPATLMARLGLEELINQTVRLVGRVGGSRPGRKVLTLVSAIVAGGSHIDHADVLRSGATRAVLPFRVMAPSTLGTFLRAFTFGHVRQLDAVIAEALRCAWRLGAGPGEETMTIDMDSTVCEVHGRQKQGAAYGYTRTLGYHPLLATCAETGEVLHARLRKGSSQRGAKRFVEELVARLRRAGAPAAMCLRADSGFWSHALVDTLARLGVGWSITVTINPAIRAAIEAIDHDAWVPITYPDGGEAAVAETTYTPGRVAGRSYRLVVRRSRLTAPAQQALWPDWRYHAFVTCATRRHQPGGMKGPTFGLSQQPVEAESSPTLGGTGLGGSSSDNAETVGHRQTGRVRQARRKGVRVQKPAVEPPQERDRLEPGGSGLGSSARPSRWATPTSDVMVDQEATVNACGVTVARLQGKSWAPTPSNG